MPRLFRILDVVAVAVFLPLFLYLLLFPPIESGWGYLVTGVLIVYLICRNPDAFAETFSEPVRDSEACGAVQGVCVLPRGHSERHRYL